MGRIGCLRSNSINSEYSSVHSYRNDREMEDRKFYTSWLTWQKALFVTGVVVFFILFLIFLSVWVIFPLVFMNDIRLQTFFTFFNLQDPKNPKFDNPEEYGMSGIVNFYLTTKKSATEDELISIGCYLVVPENQLSTTKIDIKVNSNDTVSQLLQETTYPVILYLHGIGCNRIKPKEAYAALRKHFIVIAIDHRGFGDSAPGVRPSELGVVNDTVQIYKWVQTKTKNDIYIWGHSLGTALSTHTVKALNENENIVPMGLVLESPFTTIREEIVQTSIGKLFSWMPWFEATVQRPLENNGFLFRTTTNILSVDCPIMILHSEDDPMIPYTLGKRVAEVAETQRSIPPQGNVTYIQFGKLGYGHTGIPLDPNLPQYIENFIGYCKDQNKRRD